MNATTTVVRIGHAAAISVLASVLIAVIAAAESAKAGTDAIAVTTNKPAALRLAVKMLVFFIKHPLKAS